MATIIRREQHTETDSGPSTRPVAFDFENLSTHADAYLESVRTEAAKIVQEAHAEAKRVRGEAEKAGRAAAEAAIEELLAAKVSGQMATLRPALDNLVKQLADARGEWLAYWDRAAVGLCARMAEKVLRRQLENQPEVSADWLREALELAAGASRLTVRLHPDDVANLGPEAERVAASLGPVAGATVTADPGVSRGGCVVQTDYGVIDQRIESQLDRLVQDLC